MFIDYAQKYEANYKHDTDEYNDNNIPKYLVPEFGDGFVIYKLLNGDSDAWFRYDGTNLDDLLDWLYNNNLNNIEYKPDYSYFKNCNTCNKGLHDKLVCCGFLCTAHLCDDKCCITPPHSNNCDKNFECGCKIVKTSFKKQKGYMSYKNIRIDAIIVTYFMFDKNGKLCMTKKKEIPNVDKCVLEAIDKLTYNLPCTFILNNNGDYKIKDVNGCEDIDNGSCPSLVKYISVNCIEDNIENC